jgi:hypothetical protein
VRFAFLYLVSLFQATAAAAAAGCCRDPALVLLDQCLPIFCVSLLVFLVSQSVGYKLILVCKVSFRHRTNTFWLYIFLGPSNGRIAAKAFAIFIARPIFSLPRPRQTDLYSAEH